MQEFNNSYAYWKSSIDIKAVVYIYIGGLKNGALRADLKTSWQCSKYNSIIALQNDAAKNSLWRASSSAFGASTPSNSLTYRQPKALAKQWPKSPKNDTKQSYKAPKWSPKGGAPADSKGKRFDQKNAKLLLRRISHLSLGIRLRAS